MTQLLLTRPWTTDALLAVYDDKSTLAFALSFERELAHAQAAAGLLSPGVAEQIAEACNTIQVDEAQLANAAAFAGTLAIPLVQHLRQHLGADGEAATAIHSGATSQDLADTITALQARDAAALLDDDLARVRRTLTHLARSYAGTPALGRTLMQDAAPISLGLRFAQWLAGIEDARRRLRQACKDGLLLQFGGAVGTRVGLGQQSSRVADHLADALGLRRSMPWHARRGHLAAIAGSLGIAAGALGKMARDISILGQGSRAELREPLVAGRGGSSAMPHKRNPAGCQVALSAALRTPGLVADVLAAMPQELERGLGGWQAEAPVMAELFMLVGGSADAMATVAEGLEIDEAAIAANLREAALGSDIGEASLVVDELLKQYGSD